MASVKLFSSAHSFLGGVICRKTDSYIVLLKTVAKISAMNEKLFEDDSQWMLFAIVVIMALMGYGIYIIWSWLKDEDEKDGDGNPTDKEESVFADFNYCRRNSFRPFSFRGRIGRGQFFVTFLALYGFWLVILIVKELFLPDGMDHVYRRLLVVAAYLSLYVCMAQAVKRCHDIGRSGRFLIVPFYVFVLLAKKGMQGDNEFGLMSPSKKTRGGRGVVLGLVAVVFLLQYFFVAFC